MKNIEKRKTWYERFHLFELIFSQELFSHIVGIKICQVFHLNSFKCKPVTQMTIIVPKDSIWMHTEMKIPELTKYMLKSTENNCFLPECRNARGFSYAITEDINDSRIRTKYVPWYFKEQ